MNHSKTNNAYNPNKFKEIKGKHKFFEEKYLHLFEDSPYAILISDYQCNVIECNSKAVSLFGYEKYEIIGKNFQEFPILSAVDIKLVLNDFETMINGNKPQPREFNIYKKDRSRIWVKFYISLITGSDETVYQVILQDISGRKNAEQKLKDSEELFRKVSEKANFGIILTENDGTIYYWNKTAENIYGYSYKETNGKNIYDLIIPEDFKAPFKKGIEKFKKTGELSLDGKVIDYPGKKKDGTLVPLEISFSRVKINNQWHALAIVRDISEKKELKQEISETEAKFRLVSDQNLMGIGIYQYDLFVYVNQAYADIIEYTIPEILSWDLEEIKKTIHPDDIDLVLGQSKKKQSGETKGIFTHYSFRKITRSHKIKWVDHYSKPILWNGEPAVLLAQIDITELVDAEKRLVESEKIFRNIVESVPLGLHMYEIDSAGNLIFTGSNSTADKILDLNNQQFIGKTIEEAFPPLTETDIPERLRKAALKGEPSKWEQVTYEDEKIKGAFEVHAFQTSPGKVVSSFTDITERLEAEKKIKESEEKYRSLFENMTVGFAYHKIIVDENKMAVDYEFLEANPAFGKLTGLNVNEIIGKSVTEVLPGIENDPTDWIGKYGSVALSEIPITFESYAEPLDQWYSVLSYSPKKGYFAVTFTNITDRKKSEQKLIKSEKRYRHLANELELIFDHLPGVIAYKDTKNNLLRVNKFMADAHNLKKEDMEGKSAFEFYKFEEAKSYWEDDLKVIESKKPKLNIIEPWETLESKKWNNTSKIPYIDEEGNVKGIIALKFDITDRIKAEQRLKDSEENYRSLSNQYRMLLESITDAVYALNRNWEYILVNKNAEKIVNMPVENLLGQKIFEIFPSIEETTFFRTYESVMNNRNATRVTEFFTHPDGRMGYYEVSVYPINEGILCIAKDITEEKEIERKLKGSEERYRDLFENSPIALFEQDFSDLKNYVDNLKDSGISDFEKYFDENPKEVSICGSMIKIIDVNKNALEIYKASSMEELVRRKNQIEKNLFRDLSPELLLANKRELLSLINGDTTFESETVTKTLTGDVIYIYMKTLIIPGFENTWSKVIVSILDITNRKITEQKLKESEEKFRTIAEQSFMGIEILQEGKVIYANEAAAKILDYPLEEIMMWNKSLENIQYVHPEDLQRLRELRRKRQSGDSNIKPNILYRIITKSGRIRWIDQYSKAIIYHRKEAELISIFDITEKKHAEEIILQENLKLMELNKMREDLITRVSHELKTPLTSIYGASQVLLSQHKEELNKKVLNFVEISHRGGIRLKKLIENLIDTSKLKSGKLILHKAKEDLVAVVNECVKEMMFLAKNRNIAINTDLNNEIFFKVDKLRLEQVITNILSNAIKNTPSQGKIYVSIIDNKNSVDIIIKDTGVGITLEEKSLLFEKFGKIERYGMDLGVDIEGAGLGLFISKEIVELHGGQIILESEGRNKGTKVIIKLLK